MNCPVDGEVLLVAERSGVEIDYCPKCRGVWLDRGELDKIIDRAAPPANPAQFAPPPAGPAPGGVRDHGEWGEQGEYGERGEGSHLGGRRGRRRENPLSELFDFF